MDLYQPTRNSLIKALKDYLIEQYNPVTTQDWINLAHHLKMPQIIALQAPFVSFEVLIVLAMQLNFSINLIPPEQQ